MRVLLVEDEQYLAEAIQHLLKRSGYKVDIAEDGQTGLRFAQNGIYDAIILDNMLPKLSGIEILGKLRKAQDVTPVLMLSAKSETTDKVEGLDVGADDYLAKPFKTSELIARLRAITRRHTHDQDKNETNFGDVTLSADDYTVSCESAISNLTAKEYDLLDMLVAAEGKLVPTETLFRRAWGSGVFVDNQYVSVYVSYLRTKLREIGSSMKIKSVRGIGYRLILEGGDVS